MLVCVGSAACATWCSCQASPGSCRSKRSARFPSDGATSASNASGVHRAMIRRHHSRSSRPDQPRDDPFDRVPVEVLQHPELLEELVEDPLRLARGPGAEGGGHQAERPLLPDVAEQGLQVAQPGVELLTRREEMQREDRGVRVPPDQRRDAHLEVDELLQGLAQVPLVQLGRRLRRPHEVTLVRGDHEEQVRDRGPEAQGHQHVGRERLRAPVQVVDELDVHMREVMGRRRVRDLPGVLLVGQEGVQDPLLHHRARVGVLAQLLPQEDLGVDRRGDPRLVRDVAQVVQQVPAVVLRESLQHLVRQGEAGRLRADGVHVRAKRRGGEHVPVPDEEAAAVPAQFRDVLVQGPLHQVQDHLQRAGLARAPGRRDPEDRAGALHR